MSLFINGVVRDLPGYPCAWSGRGARDSTHRYTLWRTWGNVESYGVVQYICLNPSIATETIDDPTIYRCTGFAQALGFAGFCMTNLFAFRATDPRHMRSARDPVGRDNDDWILLVSRVARMTIAAWGNHGEHLGRGADVAARVRRSGVVLHALRVNKATGQPAHPLYLPGSLRPTQFGEIREAA